MELFFEKYKDLPREGPGDDEYTKLAPNLLNDLPKEPSVLDIGCGPGMQTVEITKNIDGKIIAIDTHKPYLDQLKENANEENVSNRIEAFCRTISRSILKCVKYFFRPVLKSGSTLFKFFNARILSCFNPL